jgi:hypothetical protein
MGLPLEVTLYLLIVYRVYSWECFLLEGTPLLLAFFIQ